ncbi:MAG: multiheme c-type cytochrome, partial [Pyrinomonadaceae bacterium]
MRNPGSPTRRTFDLRLVALTLFVAFVSTFLFFNRASTSASALTDPSSADPSAAATEPAAEPQRRRQPQRRRPTPQRRPPARDRSTFSHATPGHFEDCASCHKIPTLGLRQTPTDYLTRSDVEDYPDHDACLNCHRQRYQPLFFKGARPVICAICHKGAITPRNELRFAFPKENVKSQFADVFPHDAHFVSRSLPRFKRLLGDKAKPQDSCAFCHKPNTAEFKQAVAGTSAAVAGAPAAAAETFISKPGAFMTTPQSHASCFDCHWKQGIEGSDFT